MPQAIIFGSASSSDYSIGLKFDPNKPVIILDLGAVNPIFYLIPKISEAGRPSELPSNEMIADQIHKTGTEAVQKELDYNPNDKNASEFIKNDKNTSNVLKKFREVKPYPVSINLPAKMGKYIGNSILVKETHVKEANNPKDPDTIFVQKYVDPKNGKNE